MAISKADQEKLDLEKKAVKEASEKYDALIGILLLIATSNRSKSEKFLLFAGEGKKMADFNKKFAKTQTEFFYKKYAEEALNEAKEVQPIIADIKKKLSPSQTQELENLSEQLRIGLDRRLNMLIDQAKLLATKQELAKIREKKLGMTDGSDKTQTSPKKSTNNLVFTNAKGQVVKMEAVMKLLVGDQLWANITASQRSQWLKLGFKYGLHISVMDERTTPICLSLNKTKRDLRKDQLPPMHPNCRSKIKLIQEGWDKRLFNRNLGKKL